MAALLVQARVRAQVPAAAATPAATTAAGAAPTAAMGAPNNIWSKICMTPEQKAACKKKLCASPIVQFLGGALTPYRALSGGLLPKYCPGPNDANPADLKKPADSAEGAAARIKQKEAEAKQRRLALRYLGTVDCKRYPEAEAALVNGLRADENECVRFEAALALSRGCCCTKKVLEALVLTVSGRKSNDPAECSPRVRTAAAVALEHCLACYAEEESASPQTPSPEKPVLPPPVPEEPDAIPKVPAARLIAPNSRLEDARRVMAWYKKQQPPAPLLVPVPPTRPTQEPGLAPAASPAPTPVIMPTSAALAIMQLPARAEAINPPVESPAPVPRRDVLSLMQQAWRGQ